MASAILLITLTISNVLGMLRDHFLASYIPTSQLDIYFAAFRIPDLIFNFLILGAITSAFIPVFCDFISNNKMEEGWKVTSILLNIAAVIMIFAAIVLFFLMPYLTPLVVPDFSFEKMQKTTELARILMLTPIFFSASYIFSGVLNSFNRFVAYSFAPLVYNLSIILGTFILGRNIGIIGVVYFVIIGAVLHMLIQLPSLFKLGFKYTFSFDYKNASIKKIIRLMLPRTIGMGVNQLMLLVYTAIGSALAIGSISAFNFANNIQTMPVVVLGTSFATAVFPTLTTAFTKNETDKFVFYLNRTIRTVSYLLIPTSVAFILLRAQIIRLILGSGSFGWSDTKATALALGYFSLSLLAQGLIPLLARAFYAMKNSKTPMYISIITVAVSIAIAYPLAQKMGVAGLALSFTIGSYINLILLYVLLVAKYRGMLSNKVINSVIKIVIISAITGFIAREGMLYFANLVNMNKFIGVLEQTLLTLALGFVIFVALSYVLKLEEISWALKRKINGKEIEGEPVQ
jgi:putative peptidoglycan lipid II flippase